MNQGRWLGTTAALCLCLATSLAAAAGQRTGTPVNYARHGAPGEPMLSSSAALVLDTTHSAILYSRHSDVALPIASITKLMTALVVMDAGQSLDEVLTVSDDDRSLGKGS